LPFSLRALPDQGEPLLATFIFLAMEHVTLESKALFLGKAQHHAADTSSPLNSQGSNRIIPAGDGILSMLSARHHTV